MSNEDIVCKVKEALYGSDEDLAREYAFEITDEDIREKTLRLIDEYVKEFL